MDVSQCQLRGRPVRTSNLFGPPAAPARRKGPRNQTRAGECLTHADTVCCLPMREGGQENCICWTIKASTAEPSGTSDSHTETRNASLKEEALPEIRSVSFKLALLGSNSCFQGRQLLLAHGSLAGKFKCLAII